MGLFDRFYYGKAGKRDYTVEDMPANRWTLFFMVLRDHFFDLIKVNLMQFVFWIPFFLWTMLSVLALNVQLESGEALTWSTLGGSVLAWVLGLIPCIAITGPSSAASAYLMRNWSKDQHAFLWSDFKDAFVSNWKQALLLSSITALVPAVLFAGGQFYGQIARQSVIMLIPFIITVSGGLLYALMLVVLYPMMVGYQLSFRNLVRNAFLMAAARLPQMLLARAVTFLPIVLLAVSFMYGLAPLLFGIVLYYILFGFAFSRLVYASVSNAVFDVYLNPYIEGAPVRQGLRPIDEAEQQLADEDDADEEE